MLFKKDPREWQSEIQIKELVGRSHQLLHDKILAFPYICTTETKKLQENKERLNFFTNQITEEVMRVGNDNGDPMIEHFISTAQIQVEYVDQ
jgi:hypothetical protein